MDEFGFPNKLTEEQKQRQKTSKFTCRSQWTSKFPTVESALCAPAPDLLEIALVHGIYAPYRAKIWNRVVKETRLAVDAETEIDYPNLSKSGFNVEEDVARQIELDLPRTFPDHEKFRACLELKDNRGGSRNVVSGNISVNLFEPGSGDIHDTLRRLLRAFCVAHPDVGYLQSMNFLAGFCLLVHGVNNEADAYLTFETLILYMLPGYYNIGMPALQADTAVASQMIEMNFPELHKHLVDLNLETITQLFLPRWLLCVFLNCMPSFVVVQIWDNMLMQAPFGRAPTVLVETALSMIHICEPLLLQTRNFADAVEVLKEVQRNILDGAEVLLLSQDPKVSLREKHHSELRELYGNFAQVRKGDSSVDVNSEDDENDSSEYSEDADSLNALNFDEFVRDPRQPIAEDRLDVGDDKVSDEDTSTRKTNGTFFGYNSSFGDRLSLMGSKLSNLKNKLDSTMTKQRDQNSDLSTESAQYSSEPTKTSSPYTPKELKNPSSNLPTVGTPVAFDSPVFLPLLHSPSFRSPSLGSPSIKSPSLLRSPSMKSPSMKSPSMKSPSMLKSPSMMVSPSLTTRASGLLRTPSMLSPRERAADIVSSAPPLKEQLHDKSFTRRSSLFQVLSPTVPDTKSSSTSVNIRTGGNVTRPVRLNKGEDPLGVESPPPPQKKPRNSIAKPTSGNTEGEVTTVTFNALSPKHKLHATPRVILSPSASTIDLLRAQNGPSSSKDGKLDRKRPRHEERDVIVGGEPTKLNSDIGGALFSHSRITTNAKELASALNATVEAASTRAQEREALAPSSLQTFQNFVDATASSISRVVKNTFSVSSDDRIFGFKSPKAEKTVKVTSNLEKINNNRKHATAYQTQDPDADDCEPGAIDASMSPSQRNGNKNARKGLPLTTDGDGNLMFQMKSNKPADSVQLSLMSPPMKKVHTPALKEAKRAAMVPSSAKKSIKKMQL